MSDVSGARTAVVVDGHPLWLDALERLLARLDVQVVGRATRAADAEPLIADVRPDLLVSDVSIIMPLDDDAASAPWSTFLARARKVNPDMRCVILSENDDPIEIEQAFAAGANVFCVKRAEPDDLAAAIRQSFEHLIFFARKETTAAPTRTSAGERLLGCRPHQARARDPPPGRRGPLERRAREDAVGDRADDQVPPLEHLPQAGSREPDRGEPLGTAPRRPRAAGRGAYSRVAAARGA